MDLNSHAIVAYVAGPIARFAERLRHELQPGSTDRPHITILGPRAVGDLAAAIEFARHQASQFEPFQVQIAGVKSFDGTQVVFLSVERGAQELVAMHGVLNTGALEAPEAYQYVPHITVGKHLPVEGFAESVELVRRRWDELGAVEPLRIETVAFVQERPDGEWADLAEFGLGRVPAVS